MGNLLLGFPNRVIAGAVSVSAEVAGLGGGNVQTDQGGADQAWQTPGGVTTAWLRIDAGYTGLWRAFGAFRTNWGVQAQTRWRVWQGAGYADGAEVYDSGYVPADIAPGYGQHVHAAPEDVIGRYCQLDVFDPLNLDGFLNTPLVFAGPAWQPKRNFSFASALGRVSQSARVVTRGGAVYVRNDWQKRTFDLSLAGVTRSEVWNRLMELDQYARRGNNVLFIPNPDSAERSRETIFGEMEPSAPVGFTGPSSETRSWRATLTERL